ncbi:MAG: nucleoside-diphosphate kinase [Bacteroidales bacterium]|nr:nucleoside-diphosphate kinase [Bacteroidales bacterium]
MSGNITFTMIKPGAVQNEHIGPILSMINDAGFRIVSMKYVKLRTKQAEVFYSVHKGKPFFKDLIKFITSGPVIAAILEKENAVQDYRELIGTTDPTKAAEGTIRKLFAKSIEHNAVHGSDSDENAVRECNFFFSYNERFAQDGNCMSV